MTLLRWVENVGAMTLSLAVGAHNESCVLSLISALPANSHRSMETFANARWFQAAESAQEIRDPKSYPSCALAFLISHEIAKYLERLGSRHSCSPLLSPCALGSQCDLRFDSKNDCVNLFGVQRSMFDQCIGNRQHSTENATTIIMQSAAEMPSARARNAGIAFMVQAGARTL